MGKGKDSFGPTGLTIDYRALGTISIEELRHALIADINSLREIYNIQFVKNPRLRLFVTNEYGEEISVQRPTGGTISYMHTHHYRPSCKDYDL